MLQVTARIASHSRYRNNLNAIKSPIRSGAANTKSKAAAMHHPKNGAAIDTKVLRHMNCPPCRHDKPEFRF